MFKYPEEGEKHLSKVRKAQDFTDWMYQEIKPYLAGNILEVGSGIGTYSEKVIKDFPESNIVLSDIDQEYVDNLSAKYRNKNSIEVAKLDLNNKTDFENLSRLDKKINSIYALNVLEHVKNDILALNSLYDLLEPGGRVVVLVPAHKFLYNCIDKGVGHYRRYTKREVERKIRKTKFKMEKFFYFNSLSILGWYVNGNILKKSIVSEGAIGFFNKFVPYLKFFEKYILRKKLGISLIFILKKPAIGAK